MMEGRRDRQMTGEEQMKGAREEGEEQMRGNKEWRRELTDGRMRRK